MRLLHYLSRAAVGERILIVVAHRPWPLRPAMDAMRRSLIGRGTSVPLDLGQLADQDIRRLTSRVVGEDRLLVERVVKLFRRQPVRGDRARPYGCVQRRSQVVPPVPSCCAVSAMRPSLP